MTQLTPFRDRLADRLSGGMKQKLALACTLVHEPELIVLDEPTTGVDPVSRREFWKLLSEFLARGITIVMSTPYLDEAERCARVALLHEGRVLAADEPARLRAQTAGAHGRGHGAGAATALDAVRPARRRRRAGVRRAAARDGSTTPTQRGRCVRRDAARDAAAEAQRPRRAAVARGRLHRRRSSEGAGPCVTSFGWRLPSPALVACPAVVRAQDRRCCGSRWRSARARALEASHRLAEARAREAAALAAVDARVAAERPLVARRPATRGPITSPSSSSGPARRSAARPLPRRARQLPHAARPAVADLHRRPHRCARARRARRGRRGRRRRRGGAGGSAAGGGARLLGRRDRARRGDRARAGAGARRGATSPMRGQRLERRPGAAERGGVGRGAGARAAHAAHRSAQPARRRVGRSRAPGRRRCRGRRSSRRPRSTTRPPRRVGRRRAGAPRRAQQRAERRCSSGASTRAERAAARPPQRRAGRRRGGRRRRLRAPEPADLPARGPVGRLVGRRRQCELVAVGRRPRGAPTWPGRRQRRRRRGSGCAEFDSVLAVEVRAAVARDRVGHARPSPRRTKRCARPPRRAGWSASGTAPASIAQSDVLDAELALLQAELDRTRALAGVRLAEARLDPGDGAMTRDRGHAA